MQNQEQKQSLPCSICIDQPSSASVDGCAHQFCLKCIRRWSKTKNTCPLCREPFLAIIKGKRHYKVQPPKVVTKSPTASQGTRPRVIHRRIIYVPIMLNPPPLFYYVNPLNGVAQNSDSPSSFLYQNWNFLQNNPSSLPNPFFLPSS